MSRKIFHLVKVHFDRRRPDIDQAWLNARYEFFLKNTLLSLDAQTYRDWRLWVCCGPGMEETIEPLRKKVYEGARAFFSFLSPTPKVGEHVIHELKKNAAVWEELQASEYVYVTRIDSDDLYSSDALAIAHAVHPYKPGEVEASIFPRGYLHNMQTGEVGIYTNASGPFHTIMIPTRIFLDEEAYNKYPIGDHSVVRSSFPYHVLPEWKFTVNLHGNNFLSTWDYGRTAGPVEKDWTVQRFMDQPVTFEVDDLCDEWDALPQLDKLKKVYPYFKCTAFAIPEKCSLSYLEKCHARKEWLQLAVHGITHVPNEEMRATSPKVLLEYLLHPVKKQILDEYFCKGFRPPGWWINAAQVEALATAGYWVALHVRDERLKKHAPHGWYCCYDSKPHWHGHTHDTCGNWLKEHLHRLRTTWPINQKFSWVSESLYRDS